jgi:hypothetical protein
MSAASHAALPAHHVGKDGAVELNDAGRALRAQYESLKVQMDALDHDWCQAVLASLFLRNPWIDALTLTASADLTYDDCGRCFQSGYWRVEAVEIVPAAALPNEILDDGEVDLDLAADLLSDVLNDGVPDLALSLLGDDYSQDQRLSLSRAKFLKRFGFNPDPDSVGPPPDRILPPLIERS